MNNDPGRRGGRYQWFGWTVEATLDGDVALGRLTETHEYFHRQLDDTTAFGGLVTTLAALAEARPHEAWAEKRDLLQGYSELVHETFAVGMSLLTTQRPLVPLDGYPMYDRYIEIALGLVGADTHPWVALAALRAAATACMQSAVLEVALAETLDRFEPTQLGRCLRPNHRLVTLLESDFDKAVAAAQDVAADCHGHEPWWRGTGGVTLTTASMDGDAGQLAQALHGELFEHAAEALRAAGRSVINGDGHHGELTDLLRAAQGHAPEGLVRIGALAESRGQQLLDGAALDSQTITLTAAPRRGVVIPFGSASGVSGEGQGRHTFVTLVRPDRLRLSYELDGVGLPDTPAVACIRATAFDGPRRESVRFAVVEDPRDLVEQDGVPIFVSLSSSAAAAAPKLAGSWMQAAHPDRLSLVMDTPITGALRRWCANEKARFRTATQQVRIAGMDVWIVAGRVEEGERRSALIVMPTTEFGARWFEFARVARVPQITG